MSKDPPIILNSRLIGRKGGSHAPFYLTMTIGDKMIHNVVFDSGAFSNIIPYSAMMSLNLQISRPYGNVCGLESRRVQVMGLIKNLTTYLYAHPDIECLMDVLVIDFPPSYGMLLSRKSSIGMVFSLQMDLSYSLIPNAEGHLVIPNSEPYYSQNVEDLQQVEYVDDICFVEECEFEESTLENEIPPLEYDIEEEEDMFFGESDEMILWENKGKENKYDQVITIYEEGMSSNCYVSMDDLYDLMFCQGNMILV